MFGALGLYPEVPGVGLLAIGSPLFGRASIALPHHRRATITAERLHVQAIHGTRAGTARRPKARRVALSPSAAPYIRSLQLNGHAYGKPWTTYCALARGADLSFQLGPYPNRSWGTSATAAPPSFGPHRQMPRDSCAP